MVSSVSALQSWTVNRVPAVLGDEPWVLQSHCKSLDFSPNLVIQSDTQTETYPSSSHITFKRTDRGGWILCDSGQTSWSGIFLNGRPCKPQVEYSLKTRDLIGFGTAQLHHRRREEDNPTFVFMVISPATVQQIFIKYGIGKVEEQEDQEKEEKEEEGEEKSVTNNKTCVAETRKEDVADNSSSTKGRDPAGRIDAEITDIGIEVASDDQPSLREESSDLADIESEENFEETESTLNTEDIDISRAELPEVNETRDKKNALETDGFLKIVSVESLEESQEEAPKNSNKKPIITLEKMSSIRPVPTAKKVIECVHCTKMFSKYKKYERHLKRKHGDYRVTSSSQDLLNIKVRLRRGGEDVVEDVVDDGVEDGVELGKEVGVERKPELGAEFDSKLRCRKCREEKTFPCKVSLYTHYALEHYQEELEDKLSSAGQTGGSCPVSGCSTKEGSQQELLVHVGALHSWVEIFMPGGWWVDQSECSTPFNSISDTTCTSNTTSPSPSPPSPPVMVSSQIYEREFTFINDRRCSLCPFQARGYPALLEHYSTVHFKLELRAMMGWAFPTDCPLCEFTGAGVIRHFGSTHRMVEALIPSQTVRIHPCYVRVKNHRISPGLQYLTRDIQEDKDIDNDQEYNDQEYNDQDYNDQDYNDKDYNDQDYNDQYYNDKDYNDQDYNDQEYKDQEYNNQENNDQEFKDEKYIEEEISCHLCRGSSFKNINRLNYHLAGVHYKEELKELLGTCNSCPECGKEMAMNDLVRHVGVTHNYLDVVTGNIDKYLDTVKSNTKPKDNKCIATVTGGSKDKSKDRKRPLPATETDEQNYCPESNKKRRKITKSTTTCHICHQSQKSRRRLYDHYSMVHYRTELEAMFGITKGRLYLFEDTVCPECQETKSSMLVRHLGSTHGYLKRFLPIQYHHTTSAPHPQHIVAQIIKEIIERATESSARNAVIPIIEEILEMFCGNQH